MRVPYELRGLLVVGNGIVSPSFGTFGISILGGGGAGGGGGTSTGDTGWIPICATAGITTIPYASTAAQARRVGRLARTATGLIPSISEAAA